MTTEEALKIAENPTGGHGITGVREAFRVLADALRASQAQTVQMREDAALTVEDCLRTGLLTPGNVKTAAAQVRRLPLPAPAARTCEDGVRDAARRVIEAVDACDREAERDPASQSSAPMVRYINAVAALRAALLSPAPAVAPVAQKHDPDKGCAGCEHLEGLARGCLGAGDGLRAFTRLEMQRDDAPAWCPKRAPVAAPKPRVIDAPPIDFSEEGAPDRLDAFAKALVDGLTDRTGVALDDRHGAIHVVREAVIRAIEAAGGKP